MARNTTESAIEDYLTQRVKALGGYALKVVIVGDKGSPDRWCMFPNGKIILVECKYENKGKVSLKQELWMSRFRELGFPAYVIRFKEEVDVMLHQEGLL